MSSANPLTDPRARDDEDAENARRAAAGDKVALEALISRHQRWVYAIALRMVGNAAEAEDRAQDALVRIVTRIGQFEARSSFRTWAYRIVVNTVLDGRKSERAPAERFVEFGERLEELGLEELDSASAAERDLLAEETRVGCLLGMLLCLDPDQRMAYVLGDIFEAPSSVACEIVGTTSATFRKRLERARADLAHFMFDKCGLVSSANPCRCPKKTRGLIRAGLVDPLHLKFVDARVRSMREHAHAVWSRLEVVQASPEELFRSLPLAEGPDLAGHLAKILTLVDDAS